MEACYIVTVICVTLIVLACIGNKSKKSESEVNADEKIQRRQ